MSDVQRGPGWWQASDGWWYPPHMAPQPAPAPVQVVGSVRVKTSRMTWLAAFLILVLVGGCTAMSIANMPDDEPTSIDGS